MAIIDRFRGVCESTLTYFMRFLGWALALALYGLLYFHTHIFFTVIAAVMKKRLGVTFGLVWMGIGLCILYNIIWNHFLAMVIKPGSPLLLQKIENLRKEAK